jgi:RNA polymerase sigma-70 factor, ECF subfamily
MKCPAYAFRVDAPPDSAAIDPGQLDDAALARRIAGGDPRAEAELYRRLAPRVRFYGLRHLRDEHAAADLVQQVLLLTLERLRAGRLRRPEMLASFVLGTCRMTVLDLRRNHARRERLLETYADDLPAGAAAAPRLDDERLRRCLDALPEREKTVLVLSFYDEQPAARVAAETGLSAANVRVIRHRAVKRLRDCLDGGGSA